MKRRDLLKTGIAMAAGLSLPGLSYGMNAETSRTENSEKPYNNSRKAMSETYSKLMHELDSMDIIDAHEHLIPEEKRISKNVDIFTLFSQYVVHDLKSAGLNIEDRKLIFKSDLPIKEKWGKIEYYWNQIKYSSYAKAARITVKKLYGIDDINVDTIEEISARIAAGNKPGLYQKIFDMCNIKYVIDQNGLTGMPKPIYSQMPLLEGSSFMIFAKRERFDKMCKEFNMEVNNLADCIKLLDRQLSDWKKKGVVSIKIRTAPNVKPNKKKAEKRLQEMLKAGDWHIDNFQTLDPFNNYILHECMELAAEHNFVVSAHAGVWGDFRDMDSKDLLTLAIAHPKTKYDLYHLGFPFIRDTIMIAKNNSNVYLNLCWTHVLSQTQTMSAIREIVDSVPLNKISAFGGDYVSQVEKIVGHLQMAKEDFAEVFAEEIHRGRFDFNEAVRILKQFFYDNPKNLYKLS